MIPIYQPLLSKYKKSAETAIQSEWISNYGMFIELATNSLKEILGVKYCVLMNNGTSSTHCLFKALKFKYPNISKIYIPNNVFIAPWNCALTEYPASIFEVMKLDHETLNIDTSEEYIASLEPNSAIVIVHNLGNIVNVPRLQRLRPDCIFVEDNCEGLFGKYEGIYSGSSENTLCSAISFYANKTITTGEGGAFLTNDPEIYKYIKTYFSHGMSDVRYIHNILGTNYRMTNIQAGFLYDQLNDISTILDLKKTVFDQYSHLFQKELNDGSVKVLKAEEKTVKSNWMFILIIPGINYSQLEKYLLEKQIQIRPIFYDIHQHEHLKEIKKTEQDEFASTITNFGVMLPSYPELTFEQQKYIYLCIREFLS